MKTTQIIGILIVILTLAGVAVYRFVVKPSPAGGTGGGLFPTVTVASVKGYSGGEKMGLCQNPKILEILRKKYGLALEAQKRGSVEMVSAPAPEGIDFLWPGSQTQLEIFKAGGQHSKGTEILFNSPIVLYSWDIVVEALMKEKIVVQREGTHYIVDMPRLVEAIRAKKKWKDVGLEELFGSVKVHSTDPAKSNSGSQFAALVATVLADRETLEPEDVAKVAPTMRALFKSLGFMQGSSGDLFNQYVKQGVGAFPMVAGYENQIIEFSLANRAQAAAIQSKLKILYPTPTVWSSHPMIALTDNGKKLIAALQDPEIQRIAWEEHGFRTGNAALITDPAKLGVNGIPKTVNSIVSMPTYAVMDELIRKSTSSEAPSQPTGATP
ncbi:MAG: hypothetical protein SFY92_11580 [Verrucomicrobiae bacterium]|nr:hypothetical protein [Verrucomicrobiae bacterium]